MERKTYKKKLYSEFNRIFAEIDEEKIIDALGNVEDFDTEESNSLTPRDHDEFYILSKDGMSLLEEILESIRDAKNEIRERTNYF